MTYLRNLQLTVIANMVFTHILTILAFVNMPLGTKLGIAIISLGLYLDYIKLIDESFTSLLHESLNGFKQFNILVERNCHED